MKSHMFKTFLSLIAVACFLPMAAFGATNLEFLGYPQVPNDPSISSTGAWGQNVALVLPVGNLGTTDQTTTFPVNLYLNGIFWTALTYQPIPHGTYQPGNWSVTLPTPPPPSLVNATSVSVSATIPGTTQNLLIGTMTLTALPDMTGLTQQIFSNVKFQLQQSSATWGSTIGVNYGAVTNNGAGTTGPFTVGLYISKDNYYSVNSPNCKLLATIPENSLQGYRSFIGNTWNGPFSFVNFALPTSNPFNDGTTTFYIGIIIDPQNLVAESNKINNANQGQNIDSATTAITITYPQQAIAVSSTTLNFGNAADYTGSTAYASQTVTITNPGTLPLSINSFVVSGPFQIKSVTSTTQSLTQPVTSGTIQPAGDEQWVVSLAYIPTALGNQTGMLTINSNDPNHAATTVALSGTGVATPHLAYSNPVPLNNLVTANYGSIPNDGVGGQSLSETFVLSNTGSGVLTIPANGINLSDTQGGVWSITSITSSKSGAITIASGGTIAANSTETWSVTVKFDPIAYTPYSTGLQVFSNDPLEAPNQATVLYTLMGTGVMPMTLSIADSIGTSSVMNFGSAHGSGKQKITGTLTLTNTGGLPLVFPQATGITINNSTNFQITGITSSTQGTINLSTGSATLAPNSTETWTVTVVFDPVAVGPLSSTLTILSNDPTHGATPVTLNGTGINAPGIQVTNSSTNPTGTALPFGSVLNDGPGNRIATQTVTIQNLGLQAVNVPLNGISLNNATGFLIQSIISSVHGAINISATAASIAPSAAETWTVTIGFDPVANTSYTGNLVIQSQQPTVTEALSGSGATPTIALQPLPGNITDIYIPAGQVFNIGWNANYPVQNSSTSISLVPTFPIGGGPVGIPASTYQITIPYNPNVTSYAWRPDATLVGYAFTITASIVDGTIANTSTSQYTVHVEPAGSFNLQSPLITTTANYSYQYLYNGKLYAGIVTLQPGQNVIPITTPVSGGGTVTHQVTVTLTSSLIAKEGYTYDEMKRVKTYTNGNGITTTYTYDFAGDLVQTAATNGNVVSYTYDNLKRRLSMIDNTGTTFYDYDDLDRMSDIIYSTSGNKTDANNLTISYLYDNASRMTDLTYPGGEHIQYTYDGAGRLLTANDLTTGHNTTYLYDPTTGLLHSVTRASGIVTTYGYNNVGLLNDIKHSKGMSTIAEYSYNLDSNGNATTLLTTFPDGSQKQEQYTYDGLQRLTQVLYGSGAVANSNDRTVSYAYDGVGNRTTQTTKLNGVVTQTLTYSYGSENRLLKIVDQTGAQLSSYTYDAAGNRIQQVTPSGTIYYAYDERNLLTSLISPSSSILYAYNGVGQRVGKTINGVTTKYVIDPSPTVFQNVQEYSGGALVKSYIYGADRLESNVAGGTPIFYLSDRVNSVRLTTDQSGSVTSSSSYDVFGAKQ